MSLRSDLQMYVRFARGLRGFLRETIDVEDARAAATRMLEARETHFLRLLERGVFGHPGSPYRKLLALAQCEYGDVARSLRDRGLEETLRALREAGVYVSYEEFKGRVPIVRDGRELPVRDHDFDNPHLQHAYTSESGGSTGAGTRVNHDLEHLAAVSAHELLAYEAHGVARLPRALWRGVLPDGSGVNNVLRGLHYGVAPDRWFSPHEPWELRPFLLKFRLATYAIVGLARLHGVRIPWPEAVHLERPEVVARWARETLDRHGACLVLAPVSRSLRVCLAAKQAGFTLEGAVFRVAGEPLTAAKAKGITDSGATLFTSYGFSEVGRIGMGCANATELNDNHLLTSACALIQHPRRVPGTDLEVPAFQITSLLPTAPKILLNTESDDYGVVEERDCDCLLHHVGFTTHVRDIRSFAKLTGEGMTLVASDLLHLLEHVLPERFGGSPLDYQLSEEEGEHGLTQLKLFVSPRVGEIDDDAVIATILGELRRTSVMTNRAGQMWRHAGAFRIERREPIWTGRGKLMPLHVDRNKRKGAGDRPVGEGPA